MSPLRFPVSCAVRWGAPIRAILWTAFLTVFFLFAGYLVSSPVDTPRQADLIVVMGDSHLDRARKALDLYRAGYAGHVVVMAHWAGTDGRMELLKNAGLPAGAILQFPAVTNTWREAVAVRDILIEQGWSRVMVVSDPPHLRRLNWVFGRVFAGHDWRFWLIPADMPGWRPDQWWGQRESFSFVATELLKNVIYRFRYAFVS